LLLRKNTVAAYGLIGILVKQKVALVKVLPEKAMNHDWYDFL
jgi:hypothetical protein